MGARGATGPTNRLGKRSAGILLHPTSLPGPHGSGDLGPGARAFADFLSDARQRWWQMLPIGPVGKGHSPYSSPSAFAGNPLLISLSDLCDDGLLDPRDLQIPRALCTPTAHRRVQYPTTITFRTRILRRAHRAFTHAGGQRTRAYRDFVTRHADWLTDYAVFSVLTERFGSPWTDWPAAVRAGCVERARPSQSAGTTGPAARANRPARPTRSGLAQSEAARIIEPILADLLNGASYPAFEQFIFDRQWRRLRDHCAARGVALMGDLPIFVTHDSVDVWADPKLFQLDDRSRPTVVSGVPPDLFSRTGQLWGHPLYNWSRHRQTGFVWWIRRFRRMFERFAAVRVDHFLGFTRCWAVSARAKTALRGTWQPAPGRALFQAVHDAIGPLNVIAEDLGLVTPQAAALRDAFGFPGIRLLQSGFGDRDQDRTDLPHHYPPNCVAYTGTHDNDTTVGWYRSLRARPGRKRSPDGMTPRGRVRAYTGCDERDGCDGRGGRDRGDIHWAMIRALVQSPANTVIIPMQDVLGLGSSGRMNMPGTATGNWRWRLSPDDLDRLPPIARRLAELTVVCERATVKCHRS